MSNGKDKVEQWNSQYPVGTAVDYWSVLPIDGPPTLQTETRSEAFLLEGHTACVQLKRKPACVALDNVRPSQTTVVEAYDSTADTLRHIRRVGWCLNELCTTLHARALVHDQSKLESPEKETFDKVTPRLRGLTYGSDEYNAQLAEMKPALDHHYAMNRHHPEHFPNGIDDMSLLDLIEMFCDWKAATERHADGSLERSIRVNRGRFGMTGQLASIFENTRRDLNW